MGNSKIGSPFEIKVHGFSMTWDGERLKDVTGTTLEGETQLLQTAKAAWTHKPPEGWERCPDGADVGGMWCEATDRVYDKISEGADGGCWRDNWTLAALEEFGCVPVRKTKPAVPEWAKNLANGLRGIDEDYWGDYLAKYCVPKSDADEMLPKLRRLHAYLSPGDLRDDVAALIERMEGKR